MSGNLKIQVGVLVLQLFCLVIVKNETENAKYPYPNTGDKVQVWCRGNGGYLRVILTGGSVKSGEFDLDCKGHRQDTHTWFRVYELNEKPSPIDDTGDTVDGPYSMSSQCHRDEPECGMAGTDEVDGCTSCKCDPVSNNTEFFLLGIMGSKLPDTAGDLVEDDDIFMLTYKSGALKAKKSNCVQKSGGPWPVERGTAMTISYDGKNNMIIITINTLMKGCL